MAWYGLVDPGTGDLRSVGTETMFPDGNLAAFTGIYDVVEFGDTPPNWAVKIWSAATRTTIDRPPPVYVDRLDDIEAWLLADADWVAVWTTLSQARKTQIRTGFRRVLAYFLDAQRFRGESDEQRV